MPERDDFEPVDSTEQTFERQFKLVSFGYESIERPAVKRLDLSGNSPEDTANMSESKYSPSLDADEHPVGIEIDTPAE
jgi:hypothetical protein